jgi:hypothetical protein
MAGQATGVNRGSKKFETMDPQEGKRGLVSPTGLATGNSLNGLRRSAGTMDFPCRCRPIIHTRTNPWCVACRAFYPIFPNRKKCPSRSLRFASAKEQEKPGESFAHQYRWGYYQYSGVLHSVPVLFGYETIDAKKSHNIKGNVAIPQHCMAPLFETKPATAAGSWSAVAGIMRPAAIGPSATPRPCGTRFRTISFHRVRRIRCSCQLRYRPSVQPLRRASSAWSWPCAMLPCRPRHWRGRRRAVSRSAVACSTACSARYFMTS